MPTNWKNISFLILITNIFPETSFSQDISNHAFQFVTSVKQRGPVAYRDPLGAISPDGKLIAYTDFRKIVIHPIQGGASFELQKQGAFVRYITWTPDSKNLVTYELGGKGKTWYIYNLIHKNGRPLWPGFTEFKRSELRELTWSRNGDQVAGVVLKDGKAQLWEFDNEGRNARILTEKASLESVQWNPSNGSFAGIVTVENMRFIDLNLSSEEDELIAADSYGPIAFSSEGKIIYYTLANAKGTLDLWQHNLKNNKKNRSHRFRRILMHQ